MDPHQRNRGHVTSRRDPHMASQTPAAAAGGDTGDQNPPRIDAPDGGNPPAAATDRRPQYLGSFTMIPPNESRRSEMTRVAQREEEELQRWREANRVSSVHENPERLGGNVSMAEARQRQQTDLRCSKLQKKLKQEEQERRRKQEEEEEQQRMKAEQRQKAERLEERRQQEQQRRREQLQQDHLRRQESFLQRFERTDPRPPASSSATHTSSMSEAVGIKVERSPRERELDRRRVNSDFLDRLEGRGGARQTETRPEAEERPCQASSQDFTQQPSTSSFSTATTGQRVPVLAHLKPEPEPEPEPEQQSWTQEADLEPDFDWSLMKLMNSFPDYDKAFLEDILDQCKSDYEEAYALLISTLS